MLQESLSTNEREEVQRLSGMLTQIDLADDTISYEGYFLTTNTAVDTPAADFTGCPIRMSEATRAPEDEDTHHLARQSLSTSAECPPA